MANWAPPCRVLVDCVSEWCAREGVKMRSFPGVGLGHRALKRARYCAIVFGAACSATTMSFSFCRGAVICVCAFSLSFTGREKESEREREIHGSQESHKSIYKAPQGGSLTCLRHSGSIPPLLFCACTTYHVTDQQAWPLGIPGTHLGSLSTAAWWDPCPG